MPKWKLNPIRFAVRLIHGTPPLNDFLGTIRNDIQNRSL